MLNINRNFLKYNILANYSFNFYSVTEKRGYVGRIEVIVACGVKLDTKHVNAVFLGFEFLLGDIGFKLKTPYRTLGRKLSVGNFDRNDIKSGKCGGLKLAFYGKDVDFLGQTKVAKLSFALLIDRKRKRDVKTGMGVEALAVGNGQTASYEHSVNGALEVKMGDIF